MEGNGDNADETRQKGKAAQVTCGFGGVWVHHVALKGTIPRPQHEPTLQ